MLRTLFTLLVLAVGQPSAALAVDDDAHFVQSDDFFIADSQLDRNTYIYVHLAKMTTAPKRATRDEGEFLKVHNGQSKWTANIWQSRIAVPEELKLGQHVIMFHDNTGDGMYRAPKRKEQARGGAWWYARITDMTDTYKGYVTVSGGYKVALSALRIPIPYTGAESTAVAPVSAPAPAPKAEPKPEPKPEPVAEATGPWNGGDWVEVRFGGCDTPNARRSKSPVPDPDYCDARLNGKVAVCNADFGCLYKNVTPKQCKDGSQTGRMYVCTPR